MVAETRSSAGKNPLSFNTAEAEEAETRAEEDRKRGFSRERSPKEEIEASMAKKRAAFQELKENGALPDIPVLPSGAAGSTGSVEAPKTFTEMDLNEKMIHMFMHMATKNDVQSINTKVGVIETEISELKSNMVSQKTFDTEMATMKGRIQAIEKDVVSIQNDPSASSMGSGIGDAMIQRRLETLEKKLKDNTSDDTRDLTMVVGGLRDFSTLSEAHQYLKEQLWIYYGPTMIDTYSKGDFKGLLFAKFLSKMDRDTAVKIFRTQRLKHNENTIWAKEDLAITERMTQSVLFAAKKILIGWGYDKTCIWVDLEKSSVSIGPDVAFLLTMKEGILGITITEAWKATMLGDDGLDVTIPNLIQEANDKIKKGGSATKGIGKGKKGATA